MSKKNMNLDAKATKAKKQNAVEAFNKRSFKALGKSIAAFETSARDWFEDVSAKNQDTFGPHIEKVQKYTKQYALRVTAMGDLDPKAFTEAKKETRQWVGEAFGLNTSDAAQNKRLTELNSWIKYLSGDGAAMFDKMVKAKVFTFSSHWAIGSQYNAVKAAMKAAAPKAEPKGAGKGKGKGKGEGEGAGEGEGEGAGTKHQVSTEMREVLAALAACKTDKETSQAVRGLMTLAGVPIDRQGRILAKV
jgi:hypothetical protein